MLNISIEATEDIYLRFESPMQACSSRKNNGVYVHVIVHMHLRILNHSNSILLLADTVSLSLILDMKVMQCH